jgi:hypothetical protein
VFTIPPGQDPVATRDRVFQNLTLADSGQQTQGVNTFVSGRNSNSTVDQLVTLGQSVLGKSGNRSQFTSNGIDLRPFLDRADGGTGAQLQGGIPLKTKRH